MSSISSNLKREKAAVAIQRTYRHRCYLKRVDRLGYEYRKPLYIREMNPRDVEIVKILKIWRSLLKEDERIDLEVRRFAYEYCQMMIEGLKSKLFQSYKWIGAFDYFGSMQAIAVYSTPSYNGSSIRVNYLVSAPNNLAKKKIGTVRGAATALIERIIHTARKNARNYKLLDLSSSGISKDFYKQLYFLPSGSDFYFYEKSVAKFLIERGGRAR